MGDYDLTIGVILIGLFFNTYLYGLVTYQFIVYHNTKFNDRLWIRSVVWFFFVLDTAHSAVAVYAAWDMCVVNYMNPGFLAFIPWTLQFTAVATALAAFVNHVFLGQRVLALTKSLLITIVIGILSILGLVFGVYVGIYSGILHRVAHLTPLAPFIICWLVTQSAADLGITACLAIVLGRARSAGSRGTRADTIIRRVIRGAIQTGLFASMFALADLFSFLLHRETSLYAMFAYPMGRVYTNTLLDTLIARKDYKALSNPDADASMQLHNIATPTVHSIHIQMEVITDIGNGHLEDAKYNLNGTSVC